MNLIVPDYLRADRGGHPFGDLRHDESALRRALSGFTQALAGSFQEDARRNGVDFVKRINTEAERRRRSDILAQWYRILVHEKGYSMQHALDEVPRALRAELDGTPYEPPAATRMWNPTIGGN